MAVTKSLTKAVPFEKDSKVEKWELGYTYENDSKGDATYYMSTFEKFVSATDSNGEVNFVAKAKASWTIS